MLNFAGRVDVQVREIADERDRKPSALQIDLTPSTMNILLGAVSSGPV